MINQSLARPRDGATRLRLAGSTPALQAGICRVRPTKGFRIAASAGSGPFLISGSKAIAARMSGKAYGRARGPKFQRYLAGVAQHVPKRLRHAANQQSDQSRFVSDRAMA